MQNDTFVGAISGMSALDSGMTASAIAGAEPVIFSQAVITDLDHRRPRLPSQEEESTESAVTCQCEWTNSPADTVGGIFMKSGFCY